MAIPPMIRRWRWLPRKTAGSRAMSRTANVGKTEPAAKVLLEDEVEAAFLGVFDEALDITTAGLMRRYPWVDPSELRQYAGLGLVIAKSQYKPGCSRFRNYILTVGRMRAVDEMRRDGILKRADIKCKTRTLRDADMACVDSGGDAVDMSESVVHTQTSSYYTQDDVDAQDSWRFLKAKLGWLSDAIEQLHGYDGKMSDFRATTGIGRADTGWLLKEVFGGIRSRHADCF